jgi:hypothetical protein
MILEFGLTSSTLVMYNKIAERLDIPLFGAQKLSEMVQDIDDNRHFISKMRRKKTIYYTLNYLVPAQYSELINSWFNQTIPIYCRITTEPFGEILINSYVYIEATNIRLNDSTQSYSMNITIYEL